MNALHVLEKYRDDRMADAQRTMEKFSHYSPLIDALCAAFPESTIFFDGTFTIVYSPKEKEQLSDLIARAVQVTHQSSIPLNRHENYVSHPYVMMRWGDAYATHIYLMFQLSDNGVCRLVKVGERTITHPIYETRCGDEE